MEEKLSVYKTPLNDKLEELVAPEHIKTLLEGEFITMESTCFLRGRNLADCVVIVDESQNLLYEELVTITSRIAEHAKIWFCYDPKQCDLGKKNKNDMVEFANIFDPDQDFEVKRHGFINFKFTNDDIVRSEFCRFVMKKIDEFEENKARETYGKNHGFESQKMIPYNTNLTSEVWQPSQSE
jgi:phosphate starvation-inducible PhoH-like protein